MASSIVSKNSDTHSATQVFIIQLGDGFVDLQDVVTVVDQLECLADAKSTVFQFIEEERQKTSNKKESIIKTCVAEWVSEFLDTIEEAIVCHNFKEGQARLRHVRRIIGVLDTHAMGDFDETKEKRAIPIKDCVDKFKKRSQDVLNDMVKKYQTIEFIDRYNPYITNPPKDAYAKLKDVGPIYEAAWQEIAEDITKKFRNLLVVTEKDLNERDRRFQLAQAVLLSLPDPLKTSLDLELQLAKDNIKSI